ncbi:angiopoietin-1-like [Penaeus chinensis]|uniref:angiopoietin-1-like n=1 Tax=Penaeus chinensis TaxID=139456 RepID=UPI001FB66AAB|nr:angiopoietin-1-like [Penaeus chinensis]
MRCCSVCIACLLVTFSLASLANSENVRDDPLLPIWRYLDNFSGDVVKTVRLKMKSYLRATHDNIERQFQTFVNRVKTKTSQVQNNLIHNIFTQRIKLAHFEESLKTSLRQFYVDKVKTELDLAVPAVEQKLENVIMALERQLADTMAPQAPAAGPSRVTSSSQETSTQPHDFTVLNELSNTITAMLDDITDKLSLLNAGVNATLNAVVSLDTNSEESRRENDYKSICEELVDDADQLIIHTEEFRDIMDYYSSIEDNELPRDCSDHHWYHPEARSGVYTIYPTRNAQTPVRVWCDMDESGDGSDGGWTVLLRRQNTSWGLVNFNRSWAEYASGFGRAGEGEWWLGLRWLHALTYAQPYQVRFLMRDMRRRRFKAEYLTFRVEDEADNFRLVVDGFSGNVSDAFKAKHAGLPFSTPDRDNDNCNTCSCAVNNQGGWWYNVCHWTTLTAPFPTSNDHSQRAMKWLSGSWLVLNDVTMKIRPTSYAKAFSSSPNN